MILQNTTDSIEIKLAGTITTNQLDFVADWVDVTATAYSPGRTTGVTNNTTAVTVVGSPAASTTRKVRRLVVYNTDTVSATVTVQYNENGTIRIQTKATLSSGDTLEYVEGIGFRTLNSSGAIKQVSAIGTDTIPATQVITDASNRFVTDTQKTNFQSAYNNAVLASGGATTTITFATSKYYGTPASPLSTNFTYDFTNAVAGSKAIVFHNAGSEPTYPVGTYKRFGIYQPNALNILTLEFIDSNTILLDVAYSSTAGLQPEVVTWLSKGGVATGFVLTALNQFMLDIAGMRSRILRMNVMIGETFASMFIPLIVNDDGGVTPLGGALDSNVNYLSSDWTFLGTSGGLYSSYTIKYIQTPFIPSAQPLFGQDDASIGMYYNLIGSNSNFTVNILGSSSLLNLNVGPSGGSSVALNGASTGSLGTLTSRFLIASRSSATSIDSYYNGVKTTTANNSTGKSTSAVYFGSPNVNPVVRLIGGYFIGKSIDAVQETTLRSAWSTLHSKLGHF